MDPMGLRVTQNAYFYMPGVARGMSSSRYSPPSPPPPSHLKLMSNRIGSLDFLMAPYVSLWSLMVA